MLCLSACCCCLVAPCWALLGLLNDPDPTFCEATHSLTHSLTHSHTHACGTRTHTHTHENLVMFLSLLDHPTTYVFTSNPTARFLPSACTRCVWVQEHDQRPGVHTIITVLVRRTTFVWLLFRPDKRCKVQLNTCFVFCLFFALILALVGLAMVGLAMVRCGAVWRLGDDG